MTSFFSRLIPQNLATERAKFLADPSYNPQFTYTEPVTTAQLKRNGFPDPELVKLAQRHLLGYVHRHPDAPETALSKTQMTASLNQLCHQLGIPPAKLEFDANLLSIARMRRGKNGELPVLIVNDRKPLSRARWQHLLDHEIQTHYLRSYNHHQNFLGAEEEEGLAVINGQLSRPGLVMHKNWLNYLTVATALENSFSHTFAIIRPHYVDDQAAFAGVMRAKRGLADTSQPGAFTKDLLYLKGFIRVARWILDGGDLAKLYQGDSDQPTILPTFFADPAHYRRQVAAYWRANLTEIIDLSDFTISTQLILQEALNQGARCQTVPTTNLLEVTWHGQTRYFSAQTPTEQTSLLARYVTENKQATKYFLEKAGIKVAKWQVIDQKKAQDQQYLADLLAACGGSVVLKPFNLNGGKDVLLNITQIDDLQQKCLHLTQKHGAILLEEMVAGTEYRLTATKAKLLAVTNRQPASVIGDGQQTLQQLITAKNLTKGEDWTQGFSTLKITIDDETLTLIQEQNVTLQTVIAPDQKIILKRVSNISAGGDSLIITDYHPSLDELAHRVMSAIPGLQFAGLDLLCTDPRQDIWTQNYCLVEVNDSPGLMLAQLPSIGTGVNAAKDFFEILFPEVKRKTA